MAVIRHGRLVVDTWRDLADDETLDASGLAGDDVIVSLTRWRAERAALIERAGRLGGRLGVRLRSDELAESLRDDLGHLNLVAVTFPKFNDGRGFSTARLLRRRFGFAGEIRARGHLIRDQFLFLDRCGVDAIEVPDAAAAAAWQEAMDEIGVFYQPADEARPSALHLRHGGSRLCGVL